MKVRTLFISDVHLGTIKCQAEILLNVLRDYEFEELIIIGDFIDLIALKRKFYWKNSHSNVIQKILKLSKKGVKVTYILGNHDYFMRDLIKEENIKLGDILICDEIEYTTIKGEKIYICHGDQFDGFIRLHPFLYNLGDWIYEFSIKINKTYNIIRKFCGLNYWSLSQYLKSNVKNAIKYLNDFRKLSYLKTIEKGCDSIMIGHIHTPEIIQMEDKTYYNTGDFCETCSFLYEDISGEIKLINLTNT